MSLQEKLSKISQNLQETKAEKEKKAQEEELKPIRLRIKELENQKFQLDLVKGSLELKSGKLESGEKIGKGMREYSKETKEQDKKESTRLDTLMDENKEALQSMGVENKDQLIENPEFAEEPEVVSYKKAKGEVADLGMSDSALKEKLKTLGVNIDEENFSYDSAEKALAEKLQSLESELLQEKLKTPEGKKEAIEVLSKDLEKNIPRVSFSKDEKTGTQTFGLSLDYNEEEIIIQGEKTKFEGWKRIGLVPKEITVLEKTYGKDVIEGTLLKAYENKTEIAFENFDKRTQNTDKALKADLEKSSPEKGAEANKVFLEFQNLANIFNKTLKEKAEELKAKGVDFSTTSAPGYNDVYKEFARLCMDNYKNKLVKQVMDDRSIYPPKLNFDVLKEYIEKRVEQIKELTEDIKKLETEKDVNNFYKSKTSGIHKAFENLLGTKFDGVEKSKYYDSQQDWGQAENKSLMQFNSYEEALDYLNKKEAERENTKQRMLQVVETAIDAKMKAKELLEEIETQNFGGGIYDVENEVSRIEDNKKDALVLMGELTKLESELPEKPVILDGNEITVPSVKKQLDQLRKNREIEEQKLKNKKQEIYKQESNGPKLFGKNKWEKNLANLKKEKEVLEKEINKMQNQDYDALYKKYAFRIPTKQYSEVENLVKGQKNIQGSPSEVLGVLKAQLNEIINRKAPSSVISLYKEYKDLEKKLDQ